MHNFWSELCNPTEFSVADLTNRLKKSRYRLLQEIEERENILKDGARYIELNKIKMPTAVYVWYLSIYRRQ